MRSRWRAWASYLREMTREGDIRPPSPWAFPLRGKDARRLPLDIFGVTPFLMGAHPLSYRDSLMLPSGMDHDEECSVEYILGRVWGCSLGREVALPPYHLPMELPTFPASDYPWGPTPTPEGEPTPGGTLPTPGAQLPAHFASGLALWAGLSSHEEMPRRISLGRNAHDHPPRKVALGSSA